MSEKKKFGFDRRRFLTRAFGTETKFRCGYYLDTILLDFSARLNFCLI
jgi:hypothetical protein